jgi:hypothetical protein
LAQDEEFSSTSLEAAVRKFGLLITLFSIALLAAAQQTGPWQKMSCLQDKVRCGIVVTFNPPLDSDILLVPNQVTVDVPLELHPTNVFVSSYPRGTEVAECCSSDSEDLATMSHFEKVGTYARFRGIIEKCPKQEDYEVLVYGKGFAHNPIKPDGSAIECRPIGSKDTR